MKWILKLVFTLVLSFGLVGIVLAVNYGWTNNSFVLQSGNTNLPPLKFNVGSNTATATAGSIEFDGQFHLTNQSGNRRGIVTSNSLTVNTVTVTNTTTETEIYSHSFNANELAEEEQIEFRMSGLLTNASAADDFVIRLKINGVTIHTLSRVGGLETNAGWLVDYTGTIRTAGETGTFVDFAKYSASLGTTNVVADVAPHVINTTIPNTFSVTIQWANAKAGNILGLTQASLTFRH